MNTKSKVRKNATVPYTVRLDSKLKAELEREAKLEDRTPAQFTIRAIKAMLAHREAKRLVIEEALTEAKKGKFISQSAMNAWVDSWGETDELKAPKPDICK